MSNKQETIEDIVAEMRLGVKDWKGERLGVFDCFADRIEAAHQREREAGAEAAQVCGEIGEMIGREATREKSSQVGNAAKMREALSDACYAMFNFLKMQNGGYEEMAKALDKAKAALAEPPRNCDVGTAEEQLNRFIAFCLSRKCNECPFVSSTYGECGVRWSQMPYEEGGAK